MPKKKDELGEAAVDNPEMETPESVPEITPEPPEEVVNLSSREHQELVKQAKSASSLGRTLQLTLEAQQKLQQSYDARNKEYTSLGETVRSLKQRERERELKSVEGQPDVIDSIRLKHQAEDEWEKVTKARSEHESREAQFKAKIEAMEKLEAETLANNLAKESGLKADLLLQIGSDTSDGSITYNLERMKSIAKSVPKGEEEEEEEGEEEPTAVKGQRSRAAGTGSRTAQRGYRTFADYEEAFTKGEISYEQYVEAARRFNVQI